MNRKTYTFSELQVIDINAAPELDLPGLKIRKFYTPLDGGKYMLFEAEVDKDKLSDTSCPVCHSSETTYDGYSDMRLVHDVTRSNYRVDIIYCPPRMRCKKCTARYSPSLPSIVESKQRT